MGVLRPPKVPCSLRVVGNDEEDDDDDDGDDEEAVLEEGKEEYLSDCSGSSGRSPLQPPPPPHPHPYPPGRRRRRRPRRCNVAEEDPPRRPRFRRDRYVRRKKAIG